VGTEQRLQEYLRRKAEARRRTEYLDTAGRLQVWQQVLEWLDSRPVDLGAQYESLRRRVVEILTRVREAAHPT
jgi:hypothetical protein